MKDFVLEIGTENIPASYIEPAFKQLCDEAEKLLEELRLPYEEVYATGTPRRIVLIVRDLADRQESAEETITGPPVSKGFDQDGTPTKAAVGFAKSHGLTVDRLQKIETPKGDYLGFRRRLESKKTTVLLSERLPAVIRALRFPKVMKWEASGETFARPVRWIVCLYGSAVVRFAFAGVTSGRVSLGRPWYRDERVTIRNAATYLKDVSTLGVIVDDDERRAWIKSLARKAAAQKDLVLVEDDALLYEISFMLENPRVFTGEFHRRYLGLPPEVVTTAMRSHQRYLAVTDKRGRLVSRFVAFTDGEMLGPAGVRRGNEKVLRARLEDALFYWHEDLKKGIEGLAAELDRIVFIEGLGTLGQKSQRVETIAGLINDKLDEDRRQPYGLIRRTAKLSKADLASEMIKDGKEFTLLQGLIGSHYCQEGGEDPAVVRAVGEHYMPRTPADPTPESVLGRVLGGADRIDTICGCFLAGLVPSGSQDPYGLRRTANGLIRILEHETSVGIDELIASSVELYVRGGFAGEDAAASATEQLNEFFMIRCEAFLKDRGFAYDVVAAVSSVSWMRPGIALERALEIARLRGDESFERLITGVKRVGNILSREKRRFGSEWDRLQVAFGPSGTLAKNITYDRALFTDRAEHQLYEAVAGALAAMIELETNHEFSRILRVLSGMADPIDAYFDQVLVNCENTEIRENRHNFLASVYAVFSRYADFLRIVEEGSV